MIFSPLLKQLIEALRHLPGVGPKSAQRMAFFLLERDRQGAQQLVNVLGQAIKKIGQCQQCRILCENTICGICNDLKRDHSLLCIVQGPGHVAAIEQTGGFEGVYFVLSGHLSPIDGRGPLEIGIDHLAHRLETGKIEEVVLATNATVEGEATAYYIAELVKGKGLRASRIAHGVPVGGELEYIDGGTLAKAFADRSFV